MSLSGYMIGSLRSQMRQFSAAAILDGSKNKCVALCSFIKSAASHEITYARRYFARLPSTRYFLELAQKITAVANRSLSYLRKKGEVEATVCEELSRRLAAVADGRFEPPAVTPRAELPVGEEIEALSRLKAVEEAPCTSTVEDLAAVKSLSASTADLIGSEEILQFLPPEYRSAVTKQQALFRRARACQQEVETIAAEGEVNYETAKPKMEQKCRQLTEEIARLENGKTLPLYVPLASGKDTLIKNVVCRLGKHFFDNNEDFDLDALKINLLNKMKEKFTELDVEERYAGLKEKFEQLQNRLMGEAPGRLRQAALGSLSQDLMTLLQEQGRKIHLPEEIWEHFNDLPEFIESKLEEQLRKGFSKIEEKVDKLNFRLGEMIPGSIQNLLAEGDLYVSPQFAYFLITKRGESYDLVVYPSKQDPDFYISDEYGIDSPLVYHNINPTKLNEDFFYRALTYQAFLTQQGVSSFCLNHLKEGLLDSLMVEPSGRVNAVPRDFKNPKLSTLELTLTQEAVRRKSPETSLQSIQRALLKGTIDWKFNQLLKSWSYFYHHRDSQSAMSHFKAISVNVEKLAKELREVEGKGIYTEQEFQEYSATLCHAAATLQKIKEAQLSGSENGSEKKIAAPLYIPEELRQKIEEICLTDGSTQAIEMVRSLFFDFFGEEVDETLEQVLHELFPHFEQRLQAGNQGNSGNSILEAMGFKSVWGEEQLSQIKNRRVAFSERASLLNTYRLFSSVCDFCNHTLVGMISEIVVKAALLFLFPGVGISAYLVKTLMDKASLHGPGVIRAAFPKWIADPLVAFLTIYGDINAYIRRRIGMSVMRSGLHVILNEHKESLKKILKEHVSLHTREGILDFTLPVEDVPAEIAVVEPEDPLPVEHPQPQAVVESQSAPVDKKKDPLEISFLSRIAKTAATSQKLHEAIVEHRQTKTFSADLLIAYFRVAAVLHYQTQQVFSPWKAFVNLVPVPDFMLLERWAVAQERNLTEHQKEEIARLLEYYKTNVHSVAAIWNEITLLNAFEKVEGSFPVFTDVWNSQVALYCDEFTKEELIKDPLNAIYRPSMETCEKLFKGFVNQEELFRLAELEDSPLSWETLRNAHLKKIESMKKLLEHLIKTCYLGRYLLEMSVSQIEELQTPQRMLLMGTQELTPENVYQTLQIACDSANEEKCRNTIEKRVSLTLSGTLLIDSYRTTGAALFQFIRSLPIPPETGPCPFWDRVDNPAEVLKLLERFLQNIERGGLKGDNKLSFMVIYVIAFHLAKRIPECRIGEEVRLNGMPFLYFVLNRNFEHVNRLNFLGTTLDQTVRLLRHFRFSPEVDSRIFDPITAYQLKERGLKIARKGTRFALTNCNMRYHDSSSRIDKLDTRTFNFYQQFKEDPLVLEKLRQLHPEYSWKEEKIFWDCVYRPVEASVNKVADVFHVRPIDPNGSLIEVFADFELPNGERILPDSLRALREIEARAISSMSLFQIQKSTYNSFSQRFYVHKEEKKASGFFSSLNKMASKLFSPGRDVRIDLDGIVLYNQSNDEKSRSERISKFVKSKKRDCTQTQEEIEDTFRYKGEEFLRLLGLLKSDPVFYLNLFFAQIQDDYLGVALALSDNPDLKWVIGDLFEISDKLFRASKSSKISYSSEIKWLGSLALMIAKYSDLQNRSSAPPLTPEVRKMVRAGARNEKELVKVLIASYGDESDLLRLEPDEQREALADLAMGWSELSWGKKHDFAESVFINWKPYLVQRLNRDPQFLKIVMDRLFCKTPSQNEDEVWSGYYPVFTNGTITVNMDEICLGDARTVLEYRKGHFYPFPDYDAIPEVAPVTVPSHEPVSDEIKIDLERRNHGLGMLSWFQPLKDVEVFADRNEPEKIKKIVFPKVQGLSFDVVEKEGKLRAYSKGAYSGYFIAEKQKIPSLNPYGQYLLLENDQGEQKVLLLPLSHYQMAANVLAKIGLKISLTAGISKWIPSGIQKEIVPIDCDLDASENLIPKNQEGTAYLFAFNYIQGDHALAEKYLHDLELLGKRMEFSLITTSILDLVALRPLLTSAEADQIIGLRLAALIYENMTFYETSVNVMNRSKEERVCLWLLGQKSLLYFKKKEKPLPINEYAELNLLNALTCDSVHLAGTQIPYNLRKYLGKVQGVLLHPTLSKRYAKLRMIHFREPKSFVHYGVASAIKAWGSPPQGGLSQVITSTVNAATSSGKSEPQGRGVMLYAFDLLRKVKTNWIDAQNNVFRSEVLQAFQKFEYSTDLDAAPVKVSEISPSDFMRYFPLYLALLIGEPPTHEFDEEKIALFHQKSETFKTTLRMFKGNFNKSLRRFVDMLHIVAEKPRLFNHFTFDSASKERVPSLFIDKLIDYCASVDKGPIDSNQLRSHRVLDRFLGSFQIDSYLMKGRRVLQSDAVTVPAKKLAIGVAKRITPIPFLKEITNIQFMYNTAMSALRKFEWGVGMIGKMISIVSKNTARMKSRAEAAGDFSREIPPEFARELQARDESVDAVFDYLLGKFFTVTEGAVRDDLENGQEERIEPQPLQFNDEEAVGSVFEELRQSHLDYQQRETEAKVTYRLTGDRELMMRELGEIRKNTLERIADERKQIELWVNRGDSEGSEQTELTFDEIFSYILKGEESLLATKAGLDPERLAQVKLLVNLHLVAASRWDTVFQAQDKLMKTNSTEDFSAITQALSTRRAYTFEGKQERVILGFLTFEARTGKVLWKKQAELFESMLLSPHLRKVLELIMGSGKTAFGMPLINFYSSNGKQIVINIWPKATAPTNIEEISRQSNEVYHQNAWAFKFSREKPSIAHLEAFYVILLRALDQKEQLNMTKEDLQALELNLIELLDHKGRGMVDANRQIELLCKILNFIEEHGKGNIDEAHVNFDQKTELNYPFGKTQTLVKSHTKTMEMVFVWLMELEIDILRPFKTTGEVLHKIEEADFRAIISPQLIEKAVTHFKISPEYRLAFVSYMKNEGPEPEFLKDHPQYKEICLTRGMCQTLLPFGFGSIPQVDYAVSKGGEALYARPAEGNDKPNESASIQSPYEAYVKTCILYLKNRLTKEDVRDFITHLRNHACASAQKHKIPMENTSAARYFALMSGGVDLFDATGAASPAVYQRLKESDAFTLGFVRRLVGLQIEYYPEKCSSNSHTFASMFQSFYSCTGTPDNKATYPENTMPMLDPGTQGECLAFIREKCRPLEGTERIPYLQSTTADSLIEEVLHQFFFAREQGYSCIIERGALFRGVANQTVAAKMLQFAEQHRPDIKGVIFWNDRNEQMLLEKGSSTPILLKNSTLLPHERLTYFDEAHTFAADIPQPAEAKGVVTFGEHTRLDGLFQAILRLRGLKDKQSFTFVTSGAVCRMIGKENITPDDVVTFAAKNSQVHRKLENFENAPKKMINILRSAVLKKIRHSLFLFKKKKLYQQFRELFVEKVEDNPIKLFGAFTTQGTPEEALRAYRATLERFVQSKVFSAEERREISARLDGAMAGEFPEQVTIHEGSGIDRNGLGQQVQTYETSENSIENDQEQAAENQVQQQQQQSVVIPKGPPIRKWYWDKDLDFYQLRDWLGVHSEMYVPLHRARDLCEGPLKPIGQKLPYNILCTNNFTPVLNRSRSRTSFTPFLDARQNRGYQALLVQEQGRRTWVLVDQKEANRIRKKLRLDRAKGATPPEREVKLALYDLDVDAFAAHGHDEGIPELMAEMRSGELAAETAQIKFLCGKLSYQPQELIALREWLSQVDVKIVKQAFKKQLLNKYGSKIWKNRYYGSQIHNLILELRSL